MQRQYGLRGRVPRGELKQLNWQETEDVDGRSLGSDGEINPRARFPPRVRRAGAAPLAVAIRRSKMALKFGTVPDHLPEEGDPEREPQDVGDLLKGHEPEEESEEEPEQDEVMAEAHTSGGEDKNSDGETSDESEEGDDEEGSETESKPASPSSKPVGKGYTMKDFQDNIRDLLELRKTDKIAHEATVHDLEAQQLEVSRMKEALEKKEQELARKLDEQGRDSAAAQKLFKSYGEGTSGDARQAEKKRKAALDMIKLVNKPSFFDGRNLVMRDWVIEMDNYLEAVCWDPRQTLGVATQFLKKDAMKWWDLKKKQLHAQGKVLPSTWEGFKVLLAARWDNKNPELMARNKLEKLQQGNIAVHDYLKTFEACYAHIPEYLEADKIHKFLYGLNPICRNRFQVNPTTHKRLDNFDALVAYITNYVADDVSTERFAKDMDGYKQRHLKRPSNPKPSTPKLSGVKRTQLQREGGGGSGGRGQPRVRFGNPNNVKTYTNGNEQEYTRNDHLKSWLVKEGRCWCCYAKTDAKGGHSGATCRSQPRTDLPANYTPPQTQ